MSPYFKDLATWAAEMPAFHDGELTAKAMFELYETRMGSRLPCEMRGPWVRLSEFHREVWIEIAHTVSKANLGDI